MVWSGLVSSLVGAAGECRPCGVRTYVSRYGRRRLAHNQLGRVQGCNGECHTGPGTLEQQVVVGEDADLAE